MSERKGIRKVDETELLTKCRRHCCLCYGLLGIEVPKRGQIAHIDQDRSNNKLENLVWLCLEHHDEYDSVTSQSKGITKGEIIKYKEKLESHFADAPPSSSEVDVVIKQAGVSHEITRAEVLQTAIVAIDGFAGYEAPATPTFDDVPPGTWYFDCVESGVQLGIIVGYVDRDGNLTGIFGPEDTATRAWAAKVLVNSFAIKTALSSPSPFSDVLPDHQYYDYILTAYNQSVIDSYPDNSFHPDAPLTRADMIKWLVNAQHPVLRNN